MQRNVNSEFTLRCIFVAFCAGIMSVYLAGLDEQAEDMFFRPVNKLAEKEGITQALEAADQTERVQQLNAVRAAAAEIINHDLICA